MNQESGEMRENPFLSLRCLYEEPETELIHLGTLPAAVGVPIAVGLQGVLLVAIFGGMMLLKPKVRRLE